MGLIREPLDVDFEFDPRLLTKEEKEQISNYIRAYKAKHSGKQIPTKRTSRSLTARKKVHALLNANGYERRVARTHNK